MELKINGLLNCTNTEELAEFLGDRYIRTEGDKVYFKPKNNDYENVWTIYEDENPDLDEIFFIDYRDNLGIISVPKGSVKIVGDSKASTPEKDDELSEDGYIGRIEPLVKIETKDIELMNRMMDVIEIYAKKK